jgi:hypothetical protein
MTTPLSPAAQAIWDAFSDAYEVQGPLEDMGQPLAAALRAAADQVGEWESAKAHLIAIADELEAQP